MAKRISSETTGKFQQLSRKFYTPWKFINNTSTENTIQNVELQYILGFLVLNHCLSMTIAQGTTDSESRNPNYFMVYVSDPDLL